MRWLTPIEAEHVDRDLRYLVQQQPGWSLQAWIDWLGARAQNTNERAPHRSRLYRKAVELLKGAGP